MQSARRHFAALTSANTPALIGSGRVAQASTTAAKSASIGSVCAPSAPHSAPLWSATLLFPDDSGVGSNPAPATCFSGSETGLPLGYSKGRCLNASAFWRFSHFRQKLQTLETLAESIRVSLAGRRTLSPFALLPHAGSAIWIESLDRLSGSSRLG